MGERTSLLEKWSRFFVIFALVALTTACSKKRAQVGQITFDSTVDEEQKTSLAADLKRLQALDGNSRQDTSLMRMSDWSGQSMSEYLGERVKYVVGESYEWRGNIDGSEKTVYATEAFDSMAAGRLNAEGRVVTVMSNIGGEVYLTGKGSNVLYTIGVADYDITIDSPRAGIIKVGEGLFGSANQMTSAARDSSVNSFLRLAVFFHEARHSDGNGEKTALPHAKCPAGHKFANNYACEMNSNGPYAIGRVTLLRFRDACTDCTAEQRTAMQLVADDYEGRKLGNAKPVTDDRPERVSQ